MPTTPPIERRASARRPADFPVTFDIEERPVPSPPWRHVGQALDVSSEGLRFAAQRTLNTGAKIQVTIPRGASMRAGHFPAIVRWAGSADRKSTRLNSSH